MSHQDERRRSVWAKGRDFGHRIPVVLGPNRRSRKASLTAMGPSSIQYISNELSSDMPGESSSAPIVAMKRLCGA